MILVIPQIIAIDGPAASGKSTLAKLLADELGYLFFDTGVMYRAVTWMVLDKQIPVEEEARITELAESVPIDVRPPSVSDGRDCDVLVAGQDITWQIRTPEVNQHVSVISAYAGVRKALSAQQRRIGQQGKVVMVGRDIGTVILPEADLKIYLEASAEERARRRYQERIVRGEQITFESVLATVRKRDQIDSTRDVAPLRAAEDAIIIDSDQMSIAEVLEFAKSLL
jgi:cytidylate kinase